MSRNIRSQRKLKIWFLILARDIIRFVPIFVMGTKFHFKNKGIKTTITLDTGSYKTQNTAPDDVFLKIINSITEQYQKTLHDTNC